MVRCSGVKKSECSPPSCEWISGKGCKAVAKNKTPTPPKKTPTRRRFAFMGFKDDELKAQVEAFENKVTYGLKPDTTHIVYKKDKRIMEKIEASGLPKTLLADFVAKYGFGAEAPAPAPAPLPAPKAKLTAAKKPKTVESSLNKIKVMKNYYIGDTNGPDFSRYMISTVTYGDITLRKIFRHAKEMTLNMFKKENDIRGIVDNGFFYVPSKDLFVIALKARVDSDRKNQSLNTVYGIEFTYDESRKYKIKIDQNAMVLLEEHAATPDQLIEDIKEAIKSEYEDVQYLPTD